MQHDMKFAKKSCNANMAPPPLCIFYVLSLLLKTVSRKPRDTVLAKTETGSCVAVKGRAETAPKPKVIHAIRNALVINIRTVTSSHNSFNVH